jgi:hypothetical protein
MTTNREWIERTPRHEETGAVPYNFMFTIQADIPEANLVAMIDAAMKESLE